MWSPVLKESCLLSEKNVYKLMLLPVGILVLFLIYIPVIRGSVMAFQSFSLFNLNEMKFIGFGNFSNVITSKNISFLMILGNTLAWGIGSLTLQFLFGFILALLLRKPFRGRGIYSSLVFYAWALSGFAIGLAWSWLLNGQFGLINDLLMKAELISKPIGFLSNPNIAMISVILTNTWYGVPFFGIMLLAALQSIPNELYEAAIMDGANGVVRLFRITIPYIKPTIVSTTLLRTMWIVNFPDIIFAMTNGGPSNKTNILATLMINKIFKEYDYGEGSAIGLIIMVLLFSYAVINLSITSRKGDDL